MSKSKGNVINPDKYIEKYGADTLRCYLMFLGPLYQGGDFRDTGIKGMFKFLKRVWHLSQQPHLKEKPSLEELSWQQKTIKRVEEGIKRFKYNTSLAALMEFLNFLQAEKNISNQSLNILVLLLSPFAPFLTEEIYQHINSGDLNLFQTVHGQPWPKYQPNLIKQEKTIIIVQINGKTRDKLELKATKIKKEEIIKIAKQSERASFYLKAKKIKKTIFIKGKLINFVVD